MKKSPRKMNSVLKYFEKLDVQVILLQEVPLWLNSVKGKWRVYSEENLDGAICLRKELVPYVVKVEHTAWWSAIILQGNWYW